MEGSTQARNQRDYMALYFSMLSELRTPVLELKLMAELEGNAQIQTIATQTLKLFDGFLFLNDLRSSSTELELTPYSIAAETEDVLHALEPLARLHGVKLELNKTKSRRSVGLHRQGFAHATHGLLHASITSLQNRGGGTLNITPGSGDKPTIKVFSTDFDDSIGKHLSIGGSKRMPVPSSDGLGSGFVLAKLLYQALGSDMHFAKNQFGQGFTASFKPTRQMSLIESLA